MRFAPPKLVPVLALAALLVAANQGRGQAPGEEQQALEQVRGRMQALGRRIAAKHAERKDTVNELRRVELALSRAGQKLTEIDAQRASEANRERALRSQITAARARLEEQQKNLARQIRLRYMAGHQETLRLLLNQESPTHFGRMLVYYQYLNAARTREIDAVAAEIANLGDLSAAARRSAERLDRLARERESELARLEEARGERRDMLAAIENELDTADRELLVLKAEEEALVELLDELKEVLAEFPVASQARFASLKGKLAWPVRGRVLRDYGALKAGALPATGILLATAAGSPVRAVYHGRVLFADWLPGLGLLLVVDHGEGYMSLYGHNEALLKEAGDWVTPGEVIAQVGDSGGQREPALYFEIRHGGIPESPHAWIGRRLAAR